MLYTTYECHVQNDDLLFPMLAVFFRFISAMSEINKRYHHTATGNESGDKLLYGLLCTIATVTRLLVMCWVYVVDASISYLHQDAELDRNRDIDTTARLGQGPTAPANCQRICTISNCRQNRGTRSLSSQSRTHQETIMQPRRLLAENLKMTPIWDKRCERHESAKSRSSTERSEHSS